MGFKVFGLNTFPPKQHKLHKDELLQEVNSTLSDI